MSKNQDNSKNDSSSPQRRSFLKQVAGTTVSVPLAQGLVGGSALAVTSLAAAQTPVAAAPAPAAAAPLEPWIGYTSFSSEEAAFVEKMVNVMCPADEYTPSGVDCGLAIYIDRQLAGAYGKGWKRYSKGPWSPAPATLGDQSPLSPEDQFKAGVEAANEATKSQFGGKTFDQLTDAQADAFLKDIAGGKVTNAGGRIVMADWLNRQVMQLFNEACYADPVYGGNNGKVFWKMIGYPGLPATHTNDIVQFRGKPFPGAKDPKSIVDFS